MPIHYVYRHIRLDLNVPFYIGRGKASESPRFNTPTQTYRRAFEKGTKRSQEWHSIASSSKYYAEVIFESENEQEVFEKEKEFIALYGRLHDNSGTLVNIEPGGHRCQTLERVSRLKLAKPIYVYDSAGNFFKKYEIGREAKRELNIPTSLSCVMKCHKTKGFSGGYWFFYEYQGPTINISKVYQKRVGNKLMVKNTKTGEVVIYKSVLQAATVLKIPYGEIQSKIKTGQSYQCYSFKKVKE